MRLVDKTIEGTVWSYLAEIIAKVISPLSFIILTKILSPEAYGIVAVATTLLMFIDIICDLGTSKVIIQIDEKNYQDFHYSCNAAFLINIGIGIILFILTELFANQIADYYSQPKSAIVIRVMAIQILSYSLSSIQNSLLRKSLNFRFLFWLRLITIACPIVIAIPIAFMGGGLWALVISSCTGSILQCIVLWTYSDWKPTRNCGKKHFTSLLGKSIWNTINQLVVWLPISFDTYLVAKYIDVSNLGLYTSARGLFTAASGLILSPFLPVIFSSLSKISDLSRFEQMTYIAQKILFTIAVFCAVFVFLFSDYLIPILFDNAWSGINGLIKIIFVIMGYEYFGSIILESLRAKGMFKQIALVSMLSLFLVIPCLILASKTGNINTYTAVRALTLYIPLIGNLIIANKVNIKFSTCLRNNLFVISFSIIIIVGFGLYDVIHENYIAPLIGRIATYTAFIFLFFIFNRQTVETILHYFKTTIFKK